MLKSYSFRSSRFWAIWLVFLLGVLLIFAPAWAQQPTPSPSISVVIVQDLFLRAGPGDTFLPVSSVVRGTTVTPLGRNDDASWIAVRARGVVGWVRRDLVFWSLDLFTLPVVAPESLTPIPSSTFVPPTATPLGSWVSAGDAGAFVRVGPGFTYAPRGILETGELVEAVGRTTELDWILIRFDDGFGWIARPLVRWDINLRALPVLIRGNLTPSATFTATWTASPSATWTPSATSTATLTPSLTSTWTWTPSATLTATASVTPTQTATATATALPTDTLTASASPTLTPSPTATVTASATPSQTSTLTATVTASATSTVTATFTASPTALAATVVAVVPTDTPAPSSTVLPSETPRPTATATESPTASFTPSPVPSATPLPSATPSNTVTASPNPTLTATERPIVVVEVSPNVGTATLVPPSPTLAAMPSPTPGTSATSVPTLVEATAPDGDGTLPIELWVGLAGIAVVLGYGALYWRGLATTERYKSGFIIRRCPVCNHGDLIVETRRERVMGVPSARHTVGCTNCRSLLREAGTRRWRYAVDPMDNPPLYRALNGKILSEDELKALGSQTRADEPVQPKIPPRPPRFLDDDEQSS